jgi:N12 class adenine-specific DNA methylase
MFGRLRTRWREARGTRLKREVENAFRHVDDLGDEQAQRFRRGLNYLFDDWVRRFGPVNECDVHIREHTVKEMSHDARRRYEFDIGASYAVAFLSYHIEASYLPGEDAAFVYDLTSRYISEAGAANGDAAAHPPQREGARE